MTKKEELLKEMEEDFISYVEEFLKIKDKDGNLIDIKLSRFQKLILRSILTKKLTEVSKPFHQLELEKVTDYE